MCRMVVRAPELLVKRERAVRRLARRPVRIDHDAGLVALVSTRVNALGTAPDPKSRLPLPRTTGKMSRRYSSTRSLDRSRAASGPQVGGG
jgi:hypothetical protein